MMANLSAPQTGQCRLKPDPSCVSRTLFKMTKFFRARDMGPGTCSDLELAAAEALNNAVEHGCADRTKAEVVCRWSWIGEIVQIEIQDGGSYLAPSGQASLPEDSLAERGRGALLIERLVDSVQHAVSSEGHSIRLTKRVNLVPQRRAGERFRA
jgi:anti-sigma regulatory factor (Ser/Thr protein kinase)